MALCPEPAPYGIKRNGKEQLPAHLERFSFSCLRIRKFAMQSPRPINTVHLVTDDPLAWKLELLDAPTQTWQGKVRRPVTHNQDTIYT